MTCTRTCNRADSGSAKTDPKDTCLAHRLQNSLPLQEDFNTSRQSTTSSLGRKDYRNMKNMPLLVRRRFLPRCSPAMHRRCRLLVPHAVQRCREKFGLGPIGARTTLYWRGKAYPNYVMVKTDFVMVRTRCRPVQNFLNNSMKCRNPQWQQYQSFRFT